MIKYHKGIKEMSMKGFLGFVLFVLNDPEFEGYIIKPLFKFPVELILWRSHLYYYLVRAINTITNPVKQPIGIEPQAHGISHGH